MKYKLSKGSSLTGTFQVTDCGKTTSAQWSPLRI